MRYYKGYIAISDASDVPVLLQSAMRERSVSTNCGSWFHSS